MLGLGIGTRLIGVVTIALTIVAFAAPSRAADSREQICEVRADQALGLENYPAAIALHLKLLRLNRRDALAHYHLGFAYSMTGQTREEINQYVEAARLGLVKWDLFLNLGLAYLGQNDFPKAIQALETAVLLGPDRPEAHFNLAIAYERANRLREALLEITASLHWAPDDPDAANTKAIICAHLGDLVCARDEWVHLVEVAPDYVPGRVNLRILLQGEREGDLPLAIAE